MAVLTSIYSVTLEARWSAEGGWWGWRSEKNGDVDQLLVRTRIAEQENRKDC